MTTEPAKPQPTMDRTTIDAMIRTTIDALPHPPHASAEEKAIRCDAAIIAIGALRPRDPIEAILATRIIAAHYAAMENFRCGAQRDLPPVLQLRYGAKAIQLCRLTDAASRDLTQRQCYPAIQVMPPVPLPAPRAQPAQPAAVQPAQPAAAQPSQPAPQPPPARAETPPAAAPRQPAPKPAPTPTRRQEDYAASLRPVMPALPGRTTPAPLTTAEAKRERVLDEIVARTLAPVTARAA